MLCNTILEYFYYLTKINRGGLEEAVDGGATPDSSSCFAIAKLCALFRVAELQGGLLEFFYFVVVLIFFRFVKPNTTKFFEEWYGV